MPASCATFTPRTRPSTRTTYAKAIDQLATFLTAAGMPTAVADIRREHVEHFLVALQERGMRPATVAQRYRSLQQFFRWLAEEGEIRGTPMAPSGTTSTRHAAPLFLVTPAPPLRRGSGYSDERPQVLTWPYGHAR